jgi:hypothetical protein
MLSFCNSVRSTKSFAFACRALCFNFPGCGLYIFHIEVLVAKLRVRDVIIDSRIGSVYDSAEVGSCLFER